MKIKTLLPIIALAIMVALGACSNEELIPDTNPHTGRTLSLTAAMPSEPTTRVGLTKEDDLSITLTWQANDELQLAFVQGTIKVKTTATVKTISTDKKQATFDIQIPDGFETGVYDLYGVYGGGGLSDANPTQVQLPTNAGNTTSLSGAEDTSVQNRKDVILYFESKNIDADNPQASAIFQHLGSLFSFTLQNNGGAAIDDIKEVRLSSDEANNNWGYNTGDGNQVYDFVDGFQNKEAGSDYYIYFDAIEKSIAVGEPLTFWAWYPPLPEVNWPALKIEFIKTDNSTLASANTLSARDNPTAAGKSYYFYAAWDGAELNFTDDLFSNELTIDVAEMGKLGTLLTPTQKSIVKKLTVTGQINKDDYDVMKLEMPSLIYVDLSQVTSYEGTTQNKIPNSAFGYSSITGAASTSITTIVLPESITTIGVSAFQSCEGLSGTLNIPNGVTTIESSAFYGCKGFTGNLTLPDGITTIGEFAFYFCSGLNGNLIIPDKITAIEASAFRSCSGFTDSLIIPNNVTTIGDYAFNNCKGFTGTLTLSDKLTTIGSNAFSYCEKIAGTVVLPATLNSIGSQGFYASYGITTYKFLGETVVPYTNQMLVSETSKTIQVPSALLDAYKAAPGWSTYPGTIVGY